MALSDPPLFGWLSCSESGDVQPDSTARAMAQAIEGCKDDTVLCTWSVANCGRIPELHLDAVFLHYDGNAPRKYANLN